LRAGRARRCRYVWLVAFFSFLHFGNAIIKVTQAAETTWTNSNTNTECRSPRPAQRLSPV
jgi:hypothetical protein